MKTKRIIALLMAALIIASMTACGTKGEDTPTDPAIEAGTQSPEPSVAPEEVPAVEEDEKPTESPSAKPTEKPQKTEKPEEKPEEKPAQTPPAKPTEVPGTPIPTPAPTPEPKPQTAGQKLLAAFQSKAGSAQSALSIAEALSNHEIIPFSAAAMPVEAGFLTGFDNTEIQGFTDGAMFGPIIGSVPFLGYVFTLDDGVDASAFISTLKSSANLRWNICVEAEEMVAGSVGNKVFFVMCNRDLNAEE